MAFTPNLASNAVYTLKYAAPELLPALVASYKFAKQFGNHFAGSSIIQSLDNPNIRNLNKLAALGILRKEGLTRGGRRRYYSLADLQGVERALAAIGWG